MVHSIFPLPLSDHHPYPRKKFANHLPLATRLKVLRPRHYRSLTALRALTILSYLTSLFFIFGVNLLLSAWTYLPTPHICHLGIMICLAFYVAAKTLLYLFLLERAIMLRTRPNRYHDPIYIAGLVIIIAGLGSIAIISFLRPVAYVSPTDAICRIGLPNGALIPLLTYDVLVNVALTGLYIWLTNRISQNLTWAAVGGVALAVVWPGRKYGPLETQASMLQLMMAKSILGTVAAVVVTAANLAVLIGVRGHEQDWLCFTVCCVDGMLCLPLTLYYSLYTICCWSGTNGGFV